MLSGGCGGLGSGSVSDRLMAKPPSRIATSLPGEANSTRGRSSVGGNSKVAASHVTMSAMRTGLGSDPLAAPDTGSDVPNAADARRLACGPKVARIGCVAATCSRGARGVLPRAAQCGRHG